MVVKTQLSEFWHTKCISCGNSFMRGDKIYSHFFPSWMLYEMKFSLINQIIKYKIILLPSGYREKRLIIVKKSLEGINEVSIWEKFLK